MYQKQNFALNAATLSDLAKKDFKKEFLMIYFFSFSNFTFFTYFLGPLGLWPRARRAGAMVFTG